MKRDGESHHCCGGKLSFNVGGQIGNSDDREVCRPSATIQRRFITHCPGWSMDEGGGGSLGAGEAWQESSLTSQIRKKKSYSSLHIALAGRHTTRVTTGLAMKYGHDGSLDHFFGRIEDDVGSNVTMRRLS